MKCRRLTLAIIYFYYPSRSDTFPIRWLLGSLETLVNFLRNLQALFVAHGCGKHLDGTGRSLQLLVVD